jgi:hypothetical protein
LRDALDDRQAEADACVVGAYALAAALKRLAKRGEQLWGELPAGVLDSEHHALGVNAGCPVPGEAVHPGPAMMGTKVWLNEFAPKVKGELTWAWRFSGEGEFTLRLQDGSWELESGCDDDAAVTVEATPRAWAKFLTAPPSERRLPARGIALEGSGAQLKRFARTFRAELTHT